MVNDRRVPTGAQPGLQCERGARATDGLRALMLLLVPIEQQRWLTFGPTRRRRVVLD